VLYWTTGRRVEWARLVDELTPDPLRVNLS
jgi:hypothetical protein